MFIMHHVSTASRAALVLAATSLLACSASEERSGSYQQAIDVSPAVVIRQIYGGGSNSGAPFTHDFVELFNRSDAPVTLSGYSIQYASATGTGNLGATATQLTELPDITLAPGQSYLVQQAGGAVGSPLSPDFTDPTPISMSATAGKVALVNASTSVGCNGGSSACSPAQLASIVDLVGYGSANFFEGSAAPPASNSTAVLRGNDGCQDSNDNSADFVGGAPAPRNTQSPLSVCEDGGGEGGAGGGGTGGTGGGSGEPIPGPLKIRDIQGTAHLSPHAGQTVTNVPGVVTALRSNGFYLQDPAADADAATSEGIFVFTSSGPTVAVGDSLLVTSLVAEFRPGCNACSPSSSGYGNLTISQLDRPSSIVVVSSGNPLPAPVVIGAAGRIPPSAVIADDAVAGSVETAGSVFDPDTDGLDFYESLEGMLVEVRDALAVGPSADFAGGSREIPVIADGGLSASLRSARGGIIIQPSDFNPERIQLVNSLVPLPEADVGDSFPGPVVGVLDYSFGNFKLIATAPVPELLAGGLVRETLSLGDASDNQLSIASFNVENLDPSDPPAKFAALGDVIANGLGSPDLIALEEVQDDSGPVSDGVVDESQTIALLVSAISAAQGPSYQYTSVDPEHNQDGGEPGGNIRVGFLFRTDRGLALVSRPGADFATPNSVLSQGGAPALAFSPGRIDPGNPAFANSRKPLAAQFAFNGVPLFVIANHFNSKGGDHPLFGRFQPPGLSSESQRLAQAQVVRTFVEEIAAADASAAVVVLGDLNDFEFSPPVSLLEGAGLHTLVETLPANERYSYVFQGNSQVLDQVMVSSSLFDKLAGFDIVHTNSEFADQLSDHDPAVARFTLGNLPLQCGTDALASRSLAGACSAAGAGTIAVQGVLPYAAEFGASIHDGQAYGLRLVESDVPGMFVGRFHYVRSSVALPDHHVIYTGTPSLPISMLAHAGQSSVGDQLECRRYLSVTLKTGLIGDTCGALKEGFRTEGLVASDYTIDIGPTPSRWVRFYIAAEERSVATPQLTSACAPPAPAMCSAGASPISLTAPGHASLNPPAIAVDTAYGVRLTSTFNGRLEGALVFVPPSSGAYALSLGTPKVPVHVRPEGERTPLSPSCAGKVAADASCSLFKSTQLFQLVAGTRYRVELNGVDDVSWVRLAVSLAGP
jgi:hypothetical protein